MKIVITGGTGYIGRHVADCLAKEHEIYVIVRESSNVSFLKNCVAGIIVYEEETIYDELEKIQPEILIHLSGVFYSQHTRENIKNLLESNVVFSSIVIDAAVKAGCKQIINTGSYWQNYGGEKYNPVNLYAATKQAIEDVIQYYVRAEKCKAITLQIFDTYGPDDPRNKILNKIKELEAGTEFRMSGGEQKVYFCHIEDIVRGYERAVHVLCGMESGKQARYALRGEEPVRLREVVELYLRIQKKQIDIIWGGLAYRDREIMDPTGMGEVLPGWKPEISLTQGLQKL